LELELEFLELKKKKREKLELEPRAITVPVQVTQTGLELGLILRTGTKFFCRTRPGTGFKVPFLHGTRTVVIFKKELESDFFPFLLLFLMKIHTFSRSFCLVICQAIDLFPHPFITADLSKTKEFF
jgi:hypothetical protein